MLIGSPLLIPILLLVYIKLLRRYPIKAVILERRGNNLVKTNDRLRRTIGKDGLFKYTFKKTSGDAIIIVNYDWLIHTADKPTNLFERIGNMLGTTVGTVFLYKYGSKQYKPLNIKPQLESVHFEVIDWDNMNFLVQEQRSIIEKWADKKEWAMKFLIPIVIIGVAALIFIVSTYYATQMWTKGQALCAMQGTGVTTQAAIEEAEEINPDFPVIGDAFAPGG